MIKDLLEAVGIVVFFLAMAVTFVAISVTGCSESVPTREPEPTTRLEELEARVGERLARAEELRDPVTGWLMSPTDGDGMRYEGLYAAAIKSRHMLAAEYPVPDRGRFCRYPGQACRDRLNTTWSRDAGTGLLIALWATGDLAAVQRHVAYGRAHPAIADDLPVWRMGEPPADGRVNYGPSMIGLTYQTVYALGGEDNIERHWPNTYTSGLDDYQAALQVLGIWLRGEISEKTGDPVPAPVESPGETVAISQTMYDRLQEHALREPGAPLYQYVYGLYSGNLEAAVTVCLDNLEPAGSYLRCDEYERCWLADWLFACKGTLDAYAR